MLYLVNLLLAFKFYSKVQCCKLRIKHYRHCLAASKCYRTLLNSNILRLFGSPHKAMYLARLLVVGVFCVMSSRVVVNVIGSTGCPYEWRQFGQSCYKMVNDTPLNWFQARQVCLDAGGDLAIPNSKMENEFIWKMQLDILKGYSLPKNMWLGCTYGIEATRKWKCYGDDRTEYQNWELGKQLMNGTCSTIRKYSGYWGSTNCSTVKKRVLCELSRNKCLAPLRCFSKTTKDLNHPYCLLGHIFKETIIQNPIQCCLACSKDPNCRSFNLSGKMCQLNNATISQVDANKKSGMENCVYYEYELM